MLRVIFWKQIDLDRYFIKLHTLATISWHWPSYYHQICVESFKWGTKHWFGSRGCRDIRGQSWRLEKTSANLARFEPMRPESAESADVYFNLNFDLCYFCSPLTKINVWFFISKIPNLPMWCRKDKAIEWLLRYVIFSQSNPTSIGLM